LLIVDLLRSHELNQHSTIKNQQRFTDQESQINNGAVMPAYWVARAKITDPVQYKKYTDLVPAIIAKHGGKVLARGGRYKINEGPHDFHRFVVIEFPTLEQGVACFESPEYQAAAAFRRAGGGVVENVMVDGGDATK
jgi:uncharacterized protein (DUF1330 family)